MCKNWFKYIKINNRELLETEVLQNFNVQRLKFVL
jgi:hypothetical protein